MPDFWGVNSEPYAGGIRREFLRWTCRRRRPLFWVSLFVFCDDRREVQFGEGVEVADDGIVGILRRHVDYDVAVEGLGFGGEDFVGSEFGFGFGGGVGG